MNSSEIAQWLKQNCEVWPNQLNAHQLYGDQYRAAAKVEGGNSLPCVLFQDKRTMTELCARRLRETNPTTIQFDILVEGFCAYGNRVLASDITHLEPSEFAWPIYLIEQIRGETSMGFTCLVVEMTDGQTFSYGTSFSREFFELPARYRAQDISQIHSGMRKLRNGEIVPARSAAGDNEAFWGFSELSYFTCFIDGLNGG